MQKYLARRLLLAIPTIFGVSVLIFVVMRILPGDPLAAMIDEESGPTTYSEQQKEAIMESLGLNRPLHVQYLDWMWDVARGNLGRSFWKDSTIMDMVKRRGPVTAEIGILAVIISWVVGLPIGILGALKRNSISDYFSRFFVTFFLAAPSFWVGLSFILICVVFFKWRPPILLDGIWSDPLLNLKLTLPPALIIGTGMAAIIARMSRATLLEVYTEDYVRTARSKGLHQNPIIWRHVLKNAMLPVLTISGLQFANLLGGSVAVETALSVPGLGASLAQAMQERDWMVIQNLVLIFSVIFVIVNLAVDLAYGFIDPRIRYG